MNYLGMIRSLERFGRTLPELVKDVSIDDAGEYSTRYAGQWK